jgi:PTH1 family peptidyl-tRNA hydrolase
MKLLVGLGNPGKEYEKTRHNLGFMTVDNIAKAYNESFNLEKKFKAEIAEVFISGEKVILAKPQTFMNKSGEAVQAIIAYYNISTDRVWVIYDDIDLELGSVRVRDKGSSGGHRGVQSIIDNIGTENFIRFRLGIRSEHCDELSTEEVVLQRFCGDETKYVQGAIVKATHEIEKALADGLVNISL